MICYAPKNWLATALRRWRNVWCVVALSGLLAALITAAPLSDYQQRLALAHELMQALVQTEADTAAATNHDLPATLGKIKVLLPEREEIVWEGQVIQVDNRRLAARLARVTATLDISNPTAVQQRAQHAAIEALAIEIALLEARVRAATTAATTTSAATAREQLSQILARPEYQTNQREDSWIKLWLQRVLRQVGRFLRWLFNGPAAIAQPGTRTIGLLRLLILGLLMVGLLLLARLLLQRLQRRQRKATEADEPREILGERLDTATTTADLLAAARQLAQQGDYRNAIRRAYLAFLYELEQRGKLRLHRAKTNRDYLNALRNDAAILPIFVALTRIFERVWYGHGTATEFDFEGFLRGYEEALK